VVPKSVERHAEDAVALFGIDALDCGASRPPVLVALHANTFAPNGRSLTKAHCHLSETSQLSSLTQMRQESHLASTT
jgi:hypothetical protein